MIETRRHLEEALADRYTIERPLGQGGMAIAELHACAGDRDQALRWLERAYDDRSSSMPYLAVHPTWDALRDDARFRSLVRRLRLPS